MQPKSPGVALVKALTPMLLLVLVACNGSPLLVRHKGGIIVGVAGWIIETKPLPNADRVGEQLVPSDGDTLKRRATKDDVGVGPPVDGKALRGRRDPVRHEGSEGIDVDMTPMGKISEP